jgi:hypothetical protein
VGVPASQQTTNNKQMKITRAPSLMKLPVKPALACFAAFLIGGVRLHNHGSEYTALGHCEDSGVVGCLLRSG